jgi:glucose-1-phosphatase
MSDAIELVCFDWGGVILRICRSWDEGCRAAGLPLRGETNSPEAKARRKAVHAEYQLGAIDDETFLARISATLDGLYTAAEIARVHDAWLLHEYPGVRQVIERLARHDRVQTGLLSNTNDRHWQRHLPKPDGSPADFPTIGLLTHKHASHLMRLAKPDVAIYHDFARRAGVKPASILFFDDLEENVASARSAGWRCEQIDHTGDTARQIERHLHAHGVW